MNLYAYVANDPVNATDPTGMDSCRECRNMKPIQGPTPRADAIILAVADFTPILGTVKGIAEFANNPTVMNAIGAVPGGKYLTAGRTVDNVIEAFDAAGDTDKTFHRLESPTQTAEIARKQEQSGEIWGRAPRGSDTPRVQAFDGPLPAGQRGVEFTTDAVPKRQGHVPAGQGAEVRWREGQPGVESREVGGEDFAIIKCTVTQNTQC